MTPDTLLIVSSYWHTCGAVMLPCLPIYQGEHQEHTLQAASGVMEKP